MKVGLKRQFDHGSFATERFLKITKKNDLSFSKDGQCYQQFVLFFFFLLLLFFGYEAHSTFFCNLQTNIQVINQSIFLGFFFNFTVLSAFHLSLFHLILPL